MHCVEDAGGWDDEGSFPALRKQTTSKRGGSGMGWRKERQVPARAPAGLPWSRAKTSGQDHGYALEGTAFQGVSVIRDPAEHAGMPPRVVPMPHMSDRNLSGDLSGDLTGDLSGDMWGHAPGIWT